MINNITKILLLDFLSVFIGQFWNIPITVAPYNGPYKDPSEKGLRYVIQVSHPDSDTRVFTGLMSGTTWEHQNTPCFYAGNNQAGKIVEIDDPNDSVIEGDVMNYRVSSAFGTAFKFTHFDSSRCTSG